MVRYNLLNVTNKSNQKQLVQVRLYKLCHYTLKFLNNCLSSSNDMWKLRLLLSLIWLSTGFCKIYKHSITRKTIPSKRQWGGMKTNTGQNMGGWLLQIHNPEGGFSCCGAYYAPFLVISSASCMEPFRYYVDGATVEGTAFDDDEVDNFSEIDVVYIPNEYQSSKPNMDIAVIKIRRPIPGRMIEFIKLCSVEPQPEMMYRTFAWGYDSVVIQEPSHYPKTNLVPLMDTEQCKKSYSSGSISDSVICVRQPEDRKQCLFDGGSPLVYENELCGIASFGSSCQNTTNPGIYTNIHKVMFYISSVEKHLEDLEF